MCIQHKSLQYVLVIGLPEAEVDLLIENLSGENEKKEISDHHCHVYIYDLPEKSPVKEESFDIQRKETESFLEDFKQFPPDGTLLVTGEACCLELADTYGMASIGYLGGNGKEDGETTAHADMYAEGFAEIGWTFLGRVYERHHHLPWTILQTKRCIVQEFSMEWLPDLFALYEGEGMTDYIEPLYDYEKEKEYQKAYIENMYRFYGYGMWIVREKETGNLIGRAGLEYRGDLDGKVELGYVIGTPYQGKGYATEVCLAILKYAREELMIEDVCCIIETGNKKSIRLAKKLGFRREKKLVMDGRKMIKYVKHLYRRRERCTKPFLWI